MAGNGNKRLLERIKYAKIHYQCKDVRISSLSVYNDSLIDSERVFLKIKHGGYEFIMFRFSKANYEKYFANKNVFNIDIIGKLEYNTYKGNIKKQIKIMFLETK